MEKREEVHRKKGDGIDNPAKDVRGVNEEEAETPIESPSEESENKGCEGIEAGRADKAAEGSGEGEERSSLEKELEGLKARLKEKSQKCDEYWNMLQRLAAEFDNYKKRTAREREAYSVESVAEVVRSFLPVLDNFERALQSIDSSGANDNIKEGIGMVFRQMQEVMKGLGVEEIKSLGEKFDPNLHEAIMHVKDEARGEGEIVEVFRKGYILGKKVIRHSMVKVAN